MKGIVLTIVGMAMWVSSPALAEGRRRPGQANPAQPPSQVQPQPPAAPADHRFPEVERDRRGRPLAVPAPGGQVEVVEDPSVKGGLPRFLPKDEARQMGDKTQQGADDFIKQFVAQNEAEAKALEEQKAALARAVAENERATQAVNPEEVWNLFQLKLKALLPRILALQAQVKDKRLPKNIWIKEIADKQLKEFTEGDWVATMKAVAAASPETRAKFLNQNKWWVLRAVGKVEMAEKAILWGEKYVTRFNQLPDEDKLGVLPDKKWVEVAMAASNDTREALRTPPETSIYHAKNKDMLWAQPPLNALVTEKDMPDAEMRTALNQEIKLEMVNQFLYHQKVIDGMPDKDIAANHPKMDKKEYDLHRANLAASHLKRNADAHSGRVVEAIPGAGPRLE